MLLMLLLLVLEEKDDKWSRYTIIRNAENQSFAGQSEKLGRMDLIMQVFEEGEEGGGGKRESIGYATASWN